MPPLRAQPGVLSVCLSDRLLGHQHYFAKPLDSVDISAIND
jgi:hypothetical protein